MVAVGATPSPDRVVDTVARRQHGVVTRRQAVAAGLTDAMIRHRLVSGAWVGLDPSVYALASHPFTWRRQAMALALSVDGSVASGRTAAALHGIDGFRPGPLEVTAPPGRNERARLGRVRRSAFAEGTLVDGIPCLTVAHAVLSLAGRLPAGELDGLVDKVLAAKLVRFDELVDRFVAFAAGRRPGTRSLRRALELRGGGYVPPSSALERHLYRLLDRPGLPPYERQPALPWWPNGPERVDALVTLGRLIIEGDGRRWHTRVQDFAADRSRDQLAAVHGFLVLRFTWFQLTSTPSACDEILRNTLRHRGWPAR